MSDYYKCCSGGVVKREDLAVKGCLHDHCKGPTPISKEEYDN